MARSQRHGLRRDRDRGPKQMYKGDPLSLHHKGMKTRYSKEEVAELHSAFMSGDKEAGHKIVLSVLPLCLQQIKKYNKALLYRIGADDFIHEMFIHLLSKLHQFDSCRGLITTWASWQTFSFYGNGLRRIVQIVKVPTYAFREDPTRSSVFSEFNWSDYNEGVDDIGFEASKEDRSTCYYSREADPFDIVANDEERSKQRAILMAEAGSDRNKEIVKLRLQGLTLQAIADKTNCSRENIRQITDRIFQRAKKRYDLSNRE